MQFSFFFFWVIIWPNIGIYSVSAISILPYEHFYSLMYVWCVLPLPGVWKLIRLISTGSVGWWGVMSALLSRHFVRGSDSFLLRLESKTNEE